MLVNRRVTYAIVALAGAFGTAQAHSSFSNSLLNGVQQSLALVWEKATGFSQHVGQSPFMDRIGEAQDKVQEYMMPPGKADHTPEWLLKGTEWVDDMLFQKLVHPAFPNYQLRVADKHQAAFCDPDVKQISGYLDIRDGAHLWFILYESRSSPESDPLVLWLNGGPGCSSSTGMLFELGPCNVANQGEDVEYNEYSWNTKANLLFLDQPLEVGYSYSETGETIDTSVKSAEDVYAFLQLFLTRFPTYAHLPLTVAAESYGGHYAPHIGAEIHNKNKQLASQATVSDMAPVVHINLETLMIGNGLTDPQVQFSSVAEYACSAQNPYHLFEPDSETCDSLQQRAENCDKLIEQCHRFNNRLVCVPAALYCWGSLYGPAQDSGKNLYDVRRDCDREKDGSLCYPEMNWIETLMNKPSIKKQLGVPKSVEFQSCNMQLNQQFMMQGDSMVNSAELLPPLLEDGVRVLIYAGAADFMCNAIGNHKWVMDFPNVFHEEINNATNSPLYSFAKGLKPKKAGYVVKAGPHAGNLTFAWIDHAGHMVPHDQPAVALNMLNRWLKNKDLTGFTP
ncbi:carboxypeptidase C [Malassezia yamatoensis]|uniref:Carboxypeptidase n=1 Tax=Malassezia yamatoensis TaxID=253288 RepID=A0AAJ5YR33_9BASI|nr:carboxypeptidase C [Malassezia yamatoensis]